MNLKPSLIAGSVNLISQSKKLEMKNNPKYKAAPFASIDDCVIFLQNLEIFDSPEVLKKCKKKGISIAHFILIEYLTKNPLSQKWILAFGRGSTHFKKYKNETNNIDENVVNQVTEKYVFEKIDDLHNEEARECYEQINSIFSDEDIYGESNESRKKKKETGHKGEKLTRKLEKMNKNIEEIEDTSVIDDSRGYDFRFTYKNGNIKVVEVKASRSAIEKATAEISIRQWEKAFHSEKLDNQDFEFHFWSLIDEGNESLAKLNYKELSKAVPNINIDLEEAGRWDKLTVPFSSFADQFFKPFDS